MDCNPLKIIKTWYCNTFESYWKKYIKYFKKTNKQKTPAILHREINSNSILYANPLQSSACIYKSEGGYDIEREKNQEWTMATIFLALSRGMGYLPRTTENEHSHCSLVTH